MGLGPPGLLGCPWPCQTCSQVPCNPGAAVIHVYLSISLWPECFSSDSKRPEALWRLPIPRPTIYHSSLLEVRRDQTPLPRCPGRPWHKPMVLYFLCSFPRHWHHLLRFFFLSLLLLLIFFSLLPQLSLPSFVAFCFLSAPLSPLMLLVSGNILSRFFLIQEFLSWPSIIPVILVFFPHCLQSYFHSFPSPPLPPSRTFEVLSRGVSGRSVLCRWNKGTG